MGLVALDGVGQRFFAKPEAAPDQRRAPGAVDAHRARQALQLSAFALANFLLFKFILSLAFLNSARAELEELFTLVFSVVAVALVLFTAYGIGQAAWRDLQRRRVTSDVPFALALLLGAVPVAAGLAGLPAGGAGESLLLLLFLVTLDRHIAHSFHAEMESLACGDPRSGQPPVRLVRAADALSADKTRQLELNLEAPPQQERDCAAGELRPGDIYRLTVNSVVPCDAVIRSGSCDVLERKGGAWGRARIRSAGMRLHAGSTVRTGEVLCEALQSAEDSEINLFLDELGKNREAAAEEWRARFGDGSMFNLLVLFLAVTAGFYWHGRGVAVSFVAATSASVLLVGGLARVVPLCALQRRGLFGFCLIKGIFVRSFTALRGLSAVKTLVLECNPDDPPGQVQVVSYELLDARIDEQSMASTLLAFFGRAEGPVHAAITDFLRARLGDCTLYEVADLRIFPGRGMSGRVHDCELIIGSEIFLVERGVHIQASDAQKNLKSESDTLYVALCGEIVAQLVTASCFTEDGRVLRETLSGLGVEVFLSGSGAAAGSLAPLAERTAIPSLGPEQLERLEREAPAAAYLHPKAEPSAWRKRVSAVMSVFHEVAWDLKGADLTLLNRDLSLVTSLFRLSRKVKRVQQENLICAAVLALLLAVLSVAGLASPVSVALSVLLGCCFLWLNTWRGMAE